MAWQRLAGARRAPRRFDARRLRPEEFARWDGKEPVVLTNAVDGPMPAGLSEKEIAGRRAEVAEAWAQWRQNLAVRHKDRALSYTRRLPNGSRESAWTRLGDFMQIVDPARKGTPEPGLFAFEQEPSFDAVLQPPVVPTVLDGVDLFRKCFPETWHPNRYNLLLGTTGARSSVHTDPFGWTTWNLLLSGRKRWRWVLPGKHVDRSLYVTWPEKVNLAAPGNSPVDLYATAQILAAEDPASVDGGGPDLHQFPLAADVEVAYELDQGPGEAVVFPSCFWHQTLHLSPTLAVSSQYVNENCARRVLDDVARRAGLSRDSLGNWEALPWPEQISCLLHTLEDDGWIRNS